MTEILTNDRDLPIGPDSDSEGDPRESFLKRLRFRRWVPALAAILIVGAAVAWVKRPEQLPPTNVRDQVASIRSTPTKVWTSTGQVFSQNNGQRWIEAGDVLLAIGYTWGESGAVARSIVALDAKTGSQLWRDDTSSDTNEWAYGEDYAHGVLLIAENVDDRLSRDSLRLTARDVKTGQSRWTTTTDSRRGFKLSDKDGVLLIDRSSSLLGLDLRTGQALWSLSGVYSTEGTDARLATGNDGSLVRINMRTGTTTTLHPGGGSSPQILETDDQLLYVYADLTSVENGCRREVEAIDLRDGRQWWSWRAPNCDDRQWGAGYPSVTAAGKTALISWSRNGAPGEPQARLSKVTAVDRSSGKVLWSQPGYAYSASPEFTALEPSSPADSDLSSSGPRQVVDTRSGKTLWHLDASGGATVARNVVYQHKEHGLDAYDGRTGHLLWSIPEGTQLTVLSKGIIRIDGEGRAALYTALPSR